MIFSLENNFLLLRNVKVGSTSTEIQLAKIMPESATITNLDDKSLMKKYPDFKTRNHYNLNTHASYEEIIKFLPISKVKKYVVVRNPYEVVASFYFDIVLSKKTISEWALLSKKEKDKDIELYFEGKWLKSSKWLYFYNNQSIIDHYIKYEDGIEKQFNEILPKHNLPTININIFERQYRPREINYKDIFSKKQCEMIAKEWQWEFEHLGYNI